MAANEQRKLAAATKAAGVLALSIAASICRPAKSDDRRIIMSAYPHLAGDFAL